MWAYTGLLQTMLLAPQGPVDPVYKLSVQLSYAQQEVSRCEQELEVRKMSHTLRTGQEYHPSTDHPHIQRLAQLCDQQQAWVKENSNQLAARPDPPQFHLLLRDVRQFLGSLGSPGSVLGLIQGLVGSLEISGGAAERQTSGRAAARQARGSQETAVARQARAWLRSVDEFTRRLEADYLMYRDLVLPFLTGVQQLRYGVSLLSHAVESRVKLDRLMPAALLPQRDCIESLLQTLCRMPFLSPTLSSSLEVSKRLLNDVTQKILEHLVLSQSEDNTSDVKSCLVRLLRCVSQHSRDWLAVHLEVEGDTLTVLYQLFDCYVAVWRRADEEQRQAEQDKASLYKYRSQQHGDSLTEEERDAQDLQDYFPTYDEDFDDIVVGFTLDDSNKKKKSAQSELDSGDEVLAVTLSPDDMSTVCHLHHLAFTKLTLTDWHRPHLPPVEQELNYMEPLVTGYQLAAQVSAGITGLLDPMLDTQLVGGHLVVSKALQDSATQPPVNITDRRKPYDVYKHPNPSEAIKIRPLLDSFLKRVQELLAEWPDHPTLTQLEEVMKRIQGFSVTSPLMKFVGGLEILLQKSQEWETNAARHVSLSEPMSAVTDQLIEWRKLELSCWRSSLDTVQWQVGQSATKWWFHIYDLLRQHTTSLTGDHGDAASLENSETLDTAPSNKGPTDTTLSNGSPIDTAPSNEGVAGVKAALQQFLEGSTLGEFSTRLDIVQAFHCQLCVTPAGPGRADLRNLLWNLHGHYQQFLGNITAEIARLRGPIETQLKNFVKIARWNDISYFAVKLAVEQAHKTVFKRTKEFRGILNQPITRLLTEDAKPDWSAPANQEEWAEPLNADVFINPLEDHMSPVTAPDVQATSLVQRLPTLTSRYRTHCSRVIEKSCVHQLASCLDIFTGDLIESVHDLQGLDVSHILDKEKRRSKVRHIHHRKRKSLTDLFKYLQTMGLSHKKGLMLHNLEKSDTEDWLTSQPLDVSTGLQRSLIKHRADDLTAGRWSGCDKYYRRCLTRNVLFITTLAKPSQELGLGNLDRCKGFSQHLLHLILQQREQLAVVFRSFVTLRDQVGSLHGLSLSELSPQTDTQHWMRELRNVTERTLEAVSQTVMVLESCPPGPPGGSTRQSSPYPADLGCDLLSTAEHGASLRETTTLTLKELTCSIKDMRTKSHDLLLHTGMSTSSTVNTLTDLFAHLKDIADKIEDVLKGLTLQKSDSVTLHPLADSLSYVTGLLSEKHRDFLRWRVAVDEWGTQSGEVSEDFESFVSGVDTLITHMLLAVQKAAKADHVAESDTVDEGDLQDGHVTKKLDQELSARLRQLNVAKVVGELQGLLGTLSVWSDSRETCGTCRAAAAVLSRCGPLLLQYCGYVQSVLAEYLSGHRAVTKLLSTLLAVFSELTQKGFCLPAEFAEDMAGDGATEFEDIEGGGIGEGEGVKDVSDQIETEDQLEDTRRQGEEKAEEDNEGDPDIAPEEDGIEMSDDFQGKTHDLDMEEADEAEDEDDGDDPDELDREMGDLGEAEADKLDERLWGSEDEDEEDEKQQSEKEEQGAGAGQQSEPELVAKEDNKDQTEADSSDRQPQPEEQPEDKEQPEDDEIRKQEPMDESEYNENEADNEYNKAENQQEMEPLDMPDDLDLEGSGDEDPGSAEEQNGDADDGNQEENPMDIDKLLEENSEDAGKDEEDAGKDEEDAGNEAEEKEGEPASEEPQDAPTQDGEELADQEPQEETDPEQTTNQEPGFDPAEESHKEEDDRAGNEQTQGVEAEQATTDIQQTTPAEQTDSRSHEKEGVGLAESNTDQGHQGEDSSTASRKTSQEHKSTAKQRHMGQSSENRTKGSEDNKIHRDLETIDSKPESDAPAEQPDQARDSDLYQHIQEPDGHHDKQTLDVASADQQQPVAVTEEMETVAEKDDEETALEDVEMVEETPETGKSLPASDLKNQAAKQTQDGQKEGQVESQDRMDTEDRVETSSVQRGYESSFHTQIDLFLNTQSSAAEMEKLRSEQRDNLPSSISQVVLSLETLQLAQETWTRYEMSTNSLSQELCEQLRLILEPTQASKLRGDYRTGKRLNMRKVIPYVASQFRKDKIWLRRTKPSKRQYQVMIAVDDSSSMSDNHSKQLAFESLAVIANALSLLEVGQLSISSFGESVKLLHSFQEPFSSQSGAKILQQFTFEQTKTKIAQFLSEMTSVMLEARMSQLTPTAGGETSQLLLVVSDGRGLFLEGVETVRRAVSRARQAGIFLVFVVVDNPENKDSILDIKVPIFHGSTQLPEIKPYMDQFPFPFYIILRNIDSLPITLSDALRQWFELVTAADR